MQLQKCIILHSNVLMS